MGLQHVDIADIELETGTIYRTHMNRSIGEGDIKANSYGVRLLRSGEPVTIHGSCTGYFIRHATGETIVITGAEYCKVEGAVAYVTLPQACYAVEGDFSLAIKITGSGQSSGVTGTMRIVDGTVCNTTTETLVDPGTLLPTIESLIEAIEEAVASIPEDYTELEGRVSTAEDDIDSLEGRMDTAEDDIDSLEEDVETLWQGVGSEINPLTLYRNSILKLSSAYTDYRMLSVCYGNGYVYVAGGQKDGNGYTMIVKIPVAKLARPGISESDVTANIIEAGSGYDITYNAVTGKLMLGCAPTVSEGHERAFANDVIVVDPGTLTITGTPIDVGTGVVGIAYNPTDQKIYYHAGSSIYKTADFNAIALVGDVTKASIAAWVGLQESELKSQGMCFDHAGNLWWTFNVLDGTVNGTDNYIASLLFMIDMKKLKVVNCISYPGAFPERSRGADFIGNTLVTVEGHQGNGVRNIRQFRTRMTVNGRQPLASGDDLDDCVKDGRYFSPNATVTAGLLNCPTAKAGNAGFDLDVKANSSIGLRQILTPNSTDPSFYARQRSSQTGAFGAWRLYTPDKTLTVMSYNIGQYAMGDSSNPGIPANILNEKLANLKQTFMEYSPALCGMQEEKEYVDQAQTLATKPTLWQPVWYDNPGDYHPCIRSQLPRVDNSAAIGQFSTGRYYRRCVYKYHATQTILFMSVHLSPYADEHEAHTHEQERLTELTEMFQHIAASTWDYCIVTGDFNTNSDADRTNISSMCSLNGFTQAIGGYLPWVDTCLGPDGDKHYSFDNILISSNVWFKRIKVLKEKFDDLYSDHVPVIAELELKG